MAKLNSKIIPGEQWKTVRFDFKFTNNFRLQVSNFGRLRTFNKISDGSIISGSMINGYRIIRLKLYKPRERRVQEKLDKMKQRVLRNARMLKSLQEKKEYKKKIKEAVGNLNSLKKELSKKFNDDLKQRTVNYHSLVHRLVATYFLKKSSAKQKVVAHLDFNKLNNKVGNLKWMTIEENTAHQKYSPYVIKEKKERRLKRNVNSKNTKLNVAKVKLLKKLLNQNIPVKKLVEKFKISDTQILRIKRGENWGDIKV